MEKVTVGLLPAPELPEKVAKELVDELPNLLLEQIDSNVEWEIDMIIDPLTGAAETANELIEETLERKKANGWDYAVCLTDLPLFHQKNIVLADVNKEQGASQISLPAFGSVPVKKRLREIAIQVIIEMYTLDRNDCAKKQKKFPKLFSTIRKIPYGNDNFRYIVIPRMNGRFRILLGMVHANRPWTIFPSFKSVVAVAFATGTYGLIFPTLWSLSSAFESVRFVALMLTAISSMIIWIIFAHNLWEKPAQRSKHNLRRLYNLATFFTLSIAVLIYYAMLFVLFFIAVRVFVPAELFAREARIEEAAGMMDYLKLSWLATSVATLAGALGAGLENDELVRTITYGYRQKRRYEEMEQEKSKTSNSSHTRDA